MFFFFTEISASTSKEDNDTISLKFTTTQSKSRSGRVPAQFQHIEDSSGQDAYHLFEKHYRKNRFPPPSVGSEVLELYKSYQKQSKTPRTNPQDSTEQNREHSRGPNRGEIQGQNQGENQGQNRRQNRRQNRGQNREKNIQPALPLQEASSMHRQPDNHEPQFADPPYFEDKQPLTHAKDLREYEIYRLFQKYYGDFGPPPYPPTNESHSGGSGSDNKN